MAKTEKKTKKSDRKNETMQEKVSKKNAINLAGFPQNDDGDYILPKVKESADYCDLLKQEWIHSIGKNKKTGQLLASTTTKFYQNPAFKCMWLR